MKSRVLFLLFAFLGSSLSSILAQERVFETFKDRRVINVHSVETLPQRKLDFRVTHRFGDVNGGWETLYGIENATDILIGFEYGLSDQFTVGIARTKGAGPLKQLLNAHAKYRILWQKEDATPVSATLVGTASYSTMQKSEDPTRLNYFPKSAHRLVYSGQFLVGRKFSPFFSFQAGLGYTHRNLVLNNDVNDLVSVNAAFRLKVTKAWAIIADATIPFDGDRPEIDGIDYYPTLGFGLEMVTGGGHVFQLNFTNASGIIINDYVPNTTSNWGDGEFRIGFTISRLFNL